MEGSHSLVLKYRERSVVVDMGTVFQRNYRERPQPSLEDTGRQSYFRDNERHVERQEMAKRVRE